MLTRKNILRGRSFANRDPKVRRAIRERERAASIDLLLTTKGRPASMEGTTCGQSIDKRVYVRSRALLAAVRTLPCMVTGLVGATEPAHSNWPQHGKAGRIKADDNRVAALHRDVHRELDQGTRWSAEERQAIWWDAHVRSVRELVARGLWPANVPVPQLLEFWTP